MYMEVKEQSRSDKATKTLKPQCKCKPILHHSNTCNSLKTPAGGPGRAPYPTINPSEAAGT